MQLKDGERLIEMSETPTQRQIKDAAIDQIESIDQDIGSIIVIAVPKEISEDGICYGYNASVGDMLIALDFLKQSIKNIASSQSEEQ